jgi:hypothetical protein
VRCHLEVLSSCCELQRPGEMAGGRGPQRWVSADAWRGAGAGRGRTRSRGEEMRGAGEPRFGAGERCPGAWRECCGVGCGGVRWDAIQRRKHRPRPAPDSGRDPARARTACPSPIRGGRTGSVVPKRPNPRSPTCRPRARGAAPPPLHFVDIRTHLGACFCFIPYVVNLYLREGNFHSLVPREGVPTLVKKTGR